jgi:putative phosphoribosyl transferase
MLFHDRTDAGCRLGSALAHYARRNDVVVLALPRGGVPVAFEVARLLQAPLDIFIVRKLGVPSEPELAMGAVASGGVRVLNQEVLRNLQIAEQTIERVAVLELQEIERRERVYREGRSALSLNGKIAVLVDDGLATGSSMRAAARALKLQSPAKIVVAIPVAASATRDEIGREVDEVVCLATPEPFYAVGQWYRDFTQTTDEEVHELLRRAAGLYSSLAS